MQNSKFTIRRICRIAMLAALYFALNLVSIKVGNLRITFASLPVVISALLFGPLDALLVAMIGEFFNQLVSYGITPTILLWLIPPMLRGIPIGIVSMKCKKGGNPLEYRLVLCYMVCALSALLVTAANTAAIWLDSVIYGYYTFAYVFGSALLRFVTGVVTAVVITSICVPLARILRQKGIVKLGN